MPVQWIHKDSPDKHSLSEVRLYPAPLPPGLALVLSFCSRSLVPWALQSSLTSPLPAITHPGHISGAVTSLALALGRATSVPVSLPRRMSHHQNLCTRFPCARFSQVTSPPITTPLVAMCPPDCRQPTLSLCWPCGARPAPPQQEMQLKLLIVRYFLLLSHPPSCCRPGSLW